MVVWDYGIFAHRKVLRSGNTEKFFVIVAYRKGKKLCEVTTKINVDSSLSQVCVCAVVS
jgi:hypothetical protein